MNLPVSIGFRVVDESLDWIVVDKPAPLIVHPANRQNEPTLLGGLENLLAFEIANGGKPAIVNRLDRDTSGIVLVAKHTAAARELGGIFERREARKEYLAIVHGWPEREEWEAVAPLLRAGEVEKSDIWVRQTVHPAGKPSVTRFQVERRFLRNSRNFALVRCFPETGRMHQIRVHAAYSGHPIVGDKIYSGTGVEYLEWMKAGWSTDLQRRLLLSRHALHAERLQVGEWDWHAPIPLDFRQFMNDEPLSETADVAIWNRSG